MRAAKAQSSGTQKVWMTGQSPTSPPESSTPKVSMPKALNQASTVSYRAESASEVPEAVKNSDPPYTALGADSDRGCYLAQRRRQGGTNNLASRSSVSLAAGSTPPVLSPPALEENPYTPPAIPMAVSTNAENVLPSPSPSVEARQNSVNVVEIEDEGPQPQAAEAQPVEGPKATLEELVTRCTGMDQLEKLLKDAGKSSYGPSQIAASAVAPKLPGTSSSSGLLPQGQPPGSKNQSTSESVHGIPAPSVAHKRPQEVTDEPRKRLQSLPGSSSEDAFAIPSATSVLPNQNGQSNAVVSLSGIEMHPFLRTLTQRIQLVSNLPDREGSLIERPRLGLLREACENSDYFYLVLHQLFCFEYGVRKSNKQIPGLNELHRKGLDVVTFLLVSNEEMADNAVTWFSNFPLPLGDLNNRPHFASAHAKVLRCLEKMAMFWADMRSRCARRMYPPLVDELVVLFNVESFLFQQIIFRAVLRVIWSGHPDDCFHITEEVFNRDYKEVMSRLSLRSIPVKLVKLYQQAVIRDYQHAFEFHRQHTVVEQTASMGPPRQQQSQSRLAPANDSSNNRNTSQSEHNKMTQSRLTFDLHAARRHSLSAVSRPAPVAIQAMQVCRQGSLPSQSQTLPSNTSPSPLISTFTQSPTTLQGSMNSLEQWNGQQHQTERRTSGTAGNSFGAFNNLHNTPHSTTPAQRTPNVLPLNVPGNPHMYQLEQSLGLQQHSHNRRPCSNIANPHPSAQPEIRRSLSNLVSGISLPALSPDPSIHSSPSLPPSTNPTPFLRSYPPLPNHPNPSISALHQAHLRSPTLSYFDQNENSSSVAKCYRFIAHVLMPPEELDSNNRHVNWDFRVNKEGTDWFARDVPNSHGAPPNRAIGPGSRLCRIRCISLENRAGMPTQSEWAVADNVWPGSTAVVLNGIALDIRKKTHHGKDLPIDVTSHIKEGKNNLSTAVIGFQKDSTSRFAIGVEFIQVVDEQKIKNGMKILPWLEARKRILDQSKNLDPEIEVIQSQRALDLTDPFTACIFEVPVRGINCHHDQCFDRDTFLQTRSARIPGEPCGPDEFRCPICGQDARPQSLMIDMFFVGVRTALKESGRSDVKAIILQDSGEWVIKEQDEATGESGDGTGRKSAGFVLGYVAARTASASAARQSAPREVIELDDD
ncbi:MAG: hypothetical protein Q9175_002918 [Cornicularia normoerica]